jgi:hypothetical protein
MLYHHCSRNRAGNQGTSPPPRHHKQDVSQQHRDQGQGKQDSQIDVRSRREVEGDEKNLPAGDHSHTQGKADGYGGNERTPGQDGQAEEASSLVSSLRPGDSSLVHGTTVQRLMPEITCWAGCIIIGGARMQDHHSPELLDGWEFSASTPYP